MSEEDCSSVGINGETESVLCEGNGMQPCRILEVASLDSRAFVQAELLLEVSGGAKVRELVACQSRQKTLNRQFNHTNMLLLMDLCKRMLKTR